MARLYADEQFPRLVSEFLRTMGHDLSSPHVETVRILSGCCYAL